jgi:hypothetical protein
MSQELIIDQGLHIKAEIDMQISTAKAYPRNVDSFIAEATALATADEETAASCFYCLPARGKEGKEIKGNSIRLAEIAAATWGNLHAASRIVENDGKYITAEGVAWDLQKNVKMSSQVKRSIRTKEGKVYSLEMQAVTGNAACAIALRNAIFKVVPKALVDRVYEKAVKYAVGDAKTLSSRIVGAFDNFMKIGIQPEKIFNFFNKKSKSEFDLKDLEVLVGTWTAIKDGMLKIDNAFVVDDENSNLSAKEKLNKLLEEGKEVKNG